MSNVSLKTDIVALTDRGNNVTEKLRKYKSKYNDVLCQSLSYTRDIGMCSHSSLTGEQMLTRVIHVMSSSMIYLPSVAYFVKLVSKRRKPVRLGTLPTRAR